MRRDSSLERFSFAALSQVDWADADRQLQLLAAVDPDSDPRALLRRQATRWLMADRTVDRLSELLGDRGLDWIALKGVAVGERDYPVRELRPISDVDLLVPIEAREEIVGLMLDDGWSPFHEPTADSRDYARRYGYAWQGRRAGHLLTEVHYRLWGSLPHTAAADALAYEREPSEEGHRTARSAHPAVPSPAPAFRYVVAAVHAWMVAPARPVHCWWDLEWILADREICGSIVELARRWGAQLPVTMAARHAAAIFGERRHLEIVEGLHPQLRLSERLLARTARRRGEQLVRQTQLNLARVLARRKLRLGSSAAGLLSTVWPHPHVVARDQPVGTSSRRRHFRARPRRASSAVHGSVESRAASDVRPSRSTR